MLPPTHDVAPPGPSEHLTTSVVLGAIRHQPRSSGSAAVVAPAIYASLAADATSRRQRRPLDGPMLEAAFVHGLNTFGATIGDRRPGLSPMGRSITSESKMRDDKERMLDAQARSDGNLFDDFDDYEEDEDSG